MGIAVGGTVGIRVGIAVGSIVAIAVTATLCWAIELANAPVVSRSVAKKILITARIPNKRTLIVF